MLITEEKLKSLREIETIYNSVKRNTIFGLSLHGLSYREISKRIGGSTPPVIKKILDEIRKEEEQL